MTEPVETTPTETTPETTPEPTEAPSINSQAKNLPWVKELMSASEELRAIKENQAQADREAEEKALRDAGKFDELEAKYKADMEAIETKHATEILQSNLRTELIKTGFVNDMFVNGAIQSYNAEAHGEVQAYVASLAADESHKGFLATAQGKTVHTAPGSVPAGGPDATLRGEKLKAAAKSEDKELKLKAIQIKADYFNKHGTFDGLYD